MSKKLSEMNEKELIEFLRKKVYYNTTLTLKTELKGSIYEYFAILLEEHTESNPLKCDLVLNTYKNGYLDNDYKPHLIMIYKDTTDSNNVYIVLEGEAEYINLFSCSTDFIIEIMNKLEESYGNKEKDFD